METVIRAENVFKEYRLGTINHGTLYRDLQALFARIRGKPDPNAPLHAAERLIGEHFFALRDINFEIKKGDVVGIIGKNGAGKSTLLKILSRITAPSRGTIKIQGRMASLLEVGTGFHPELTGRENIFLNGAILGMTRRDIARKLDEIIDFSGVETHIDTPVKRYSSGMYVRLAFAVSAFLEPDILVVDEVLAVGDAEFQKKCLGKLKEVSDSFGRTVLFVSHNLSAVSSLCTKAMLLAGGRLQLYDKTSEVLRTYRSTTNKPLDLTQIALRDRLNRCDGRLLFQSFEILDSHGNQTLSIRRGGSFALAFRLKAREDIAGFRIYIEMLDAASNRVTTTAMQIFPRFRLRPEEEAEIVINVNGRTLRSNEYAFYLWVGDTEGGRAFDVLDNNVNLPMLTIEPATSDPQTNVGLVDVPFTARCRVKTRQTNKKPHTNIPLAKKN